MSKDIYHSGRIIEINGTHVTVSIISSSACSSCSIKKACTMSEQEEKLIDITTQRASTYKVGEEVNLSIKQSTGYKAVLIAYILPLLLIIITLIITTRIGLSDGISGILSLITLCLYYFLYYLLRHKIEYQIEIEISKK